MIILTNKLKSQYQQKLKFLLRESPKIQRISTFILNKEL